jgi:hypothetical protein
MQLLLPANVPPSRKERAAFTKFVGCVRRARATEVLYLPQWSTSTLIERAPVIEAVPDEMDLLIRDVDLDILRKRNEVRMLEAVLAFNWNQPFDAIFMKGIQQCLPI